MWPFRRDKKYFTLDEVNKIKKSLEDEFKSSIDEIKGKKSASLQDEIKDVLTNVFNGLIKYNGNGKSHSDVVDERREYYKKTGGFGYKFSKDCVYWESTMAVSIGNSVSRFTDQVEYMTMEAINERVEKLLTDEELIFKLVDRINSAQLK